MATINPYWGTTSVMGGMSTAGGMSGAVSSTMYAPTHWPGVSRAVQVDQNSPPDTIKRIIEAQKVQIEDLLQKNREAEDKLRKVTAELIKLKSAMTRMR